MTSKLAPLTGIASLALIIAGGLYGGKPPAEQGLKSAEDLAAAYAAQGDRLMVGVFLMGLGLVFLVYFASVLKAALDTAAAGTSRLPRVAFAGLLVFVVGAAIDFSLMIAMVEGATDKVDPLVVQALSTYWENDFVPFAVGIVLLTSASAISILKYGGLPKWVGWLAGLILVVSLIPPIAPAAFPATGIWILLASVALLLEARKAVGPPAM